VPSPERVAQRATDDDERNVRGDALKEGDAVPVVEHFSKVRRELSDRARE
jgi:hypothetical protein